MLTPAWAAPDGKALFNAHCAECHGESGKGDGEAAEYYDPKPRDLTSPTYKIGTGDATLLKFISEGPGSSKTCGCTMTGEDRQALVDYLKTLRKKP